MNYDIYWCDDEKTIIYANYPDKWTWDDFYLIREQVHKLIDTSDAPRVDLIADMTHAKMPKGSPFKHSTTVTRNKHPRTQLLVIVSQQTMIRTMTNIASKISPQNTASFRLVGTIDEAVALIQGDRASADD